MTRSLLVLLLATGLGVAAAQAQSLDDLRRGAAAYYVFADESDITIEVKVWGAVRNPGLYEVRQGLHLSTLLSLAGGPQPAVRDPQTTSTLRLRLWRPHPDGNDQLILESRMDNEILLLDQDPVLMHGDILISDESLRRRFSWRDGLTILTAAGTVALILERALSTN